MRKICLTMIAIIGFCTEARAACDIKDWRIVPGTGSLSYVEGTTTCERGTIYIRIFAPEDKWIGNATGYIKGHTFAGSFEGKVSGETTIRYVIDPR